MFEHRRNALGRITDPSTFDAILLIALISKADLPIPIQRSKDWGN